MKLLNPSQKLLSTNVEVSYYQTLQPATVPQYDSKFSSLDQFSEGAHKESFCHLCALYFKRHRFERWL